MKHSELHAIVHNVAASLGAGVSMLTGFYTLDLFGNAASSKDRRVTIDFITGCVIEGQPDRSTVIAAGLSAGALRRLVSEAGGSIADLTEASATYFGNRTFTVSVTDAGGKKTSADYQDHSGKRIRELDQQGRIRRRPARRSCDGQISED